MISKGANQWDGALIEAAANNHQGIVELLLSYHDSTRWYDMHESWDVAMRQAGSREMLDFLYENMPR